jgi:hypothetical protein
LDFFPRNTCLECYVLEKVTKVIRIVGSSHVDQAVGTLTNKGLTRQCPRLRTLDQGKRALDKLEDKVSGEQDDICVLTRQSLV